MICELCFHHCDLSEGQTGFCRARACRDGKIVPLHLSRFFPRYRMIDKLSTPVERVYHLAGAAREYLSFVYTGNC